MANGTVTAPPRVASQRTAKKATMMFCLSNTARILKKKRSEVDGMATAQHQPMAIGSAAHEETGATGAISMSRWLSGS